MSEKIKAIMVLEIIGKPAQYLVETLENIIKQMGAENGVIVKNKNIREPKKMEEKTGIANPSKQGVKIEQKDFYITFAEIEVETENIFTLVSLMFKYMPAHIEILSPEHLSIPNTGWNDLLNDLTRRLHAYDEVARVLQVEKAILENQVKNLADKINREKVKQKKKK